MKISIEKYPFDIILCIILNLILLLLIFLDIGIITRIILGSIFILFIPGYVFIFVLFPTRKKDKSIDLIERIALSFGTSIAIVPLIALCLNYSPWGIRLEPLILFLSLFVFGMGVIAVFRWFKTSPDERFILTIQISLPKSEKKFFSVIFFFMICSILIMGVTVLFVIVTPKSGEHFTEFYLLDLNHRTELYQKNFTLDDNITGIVGVLNHEYRTINYTIELWLINQTVVYYKSTGENQTIYSNMWFIDKITTNLSHTDVKAEQPWVPQWESNYSFPITKVGSFKLTFLLFTTPTDNYSLDKDYKDIAVQKINQAYREVHLWINVH